jgi:uncharacterized protein (DUF58 family)
MRSKLSESVLIPRPRTLGGFLLLLAVLALGAGALRQELALTLVGAIFMASLGYSFIAVFVLACVHGKKSQTLQVRMVQKNIETGKIAEPVLRREGEGRFFRLPGILIRYELRLATRDGREIRHLFDPGPDMEGKKQDKTGAFIVHERGAYYGDRDIFISCDILGFFHASRPIPQDRAARLLAMPAAAPEVIPVYIQSGGDSRRQTLRYQRTDNLIDHRPYIPGDDPRRINWKLFGHSGDLFVREGENEPPPHSKLSILIDTLTDPVLYSPEAGRRSVDLLCENALAVALEYKRRGMEIMLGYNGGELTGVKPGELPAFLSYPSALIPETEGDLPSPPEDRNVLILALPRSSSESSALDRFLKNRRSGQGVDLAFLHEGGELEEYAEAAVRLYNRKGGIRIHARQVRL